MCSTVPPVPTPAASAPTASLSALLSRASAPSTATHRLAHKRAASPSTGSHADSSDECDEADSGEEELSSDDDAVDTVLVGPADDGTLGCVEGDGGDTPAGDAAMLPHRLLTISVKKPVRGRRPRFVIGRWIATLYGRDYVGTSGFFDLPAVIGATTT